LAPEYTDWLVEIGNCELGLGNTGVAKANFLRAYKDKKKRGEEWISALTALARTLYFESDFIGSLKLLDTLLTGRIDLKFYQEPSFNDAIDLRLFLIEYAKRAPECLKIFARAEYFQEQCRLKDAIATIDSLIDGYPDNPILPEAYFKKSEILFILKQYPECKSNLEFYLTQFPNHFWADRAMQYLGTIYEKLGQFSDAMKYYDLILKEHPESLFTDEIRSRIDELQRATSR
jgi:tetratricopeptide (TPR) repeat protein